MFTKTIRWLRKHSKATLSVVLAILFVLVNLVAYLHAWSMTHFVRGGERTSSPESLSFFQKAKVILGGVNIPRPVSDRSPESLGLRFEVHRFGGSDANSLEAWSIGRPRSQGIVVLCHGYSASKAHLLPEAAAFHEMGFTTFLIDFRGSGGSTGSETTIGMLEADDVTSACQFVRERWPDEPLVLFGTSMGSAAILRAIAVNGTKADALVLECPFDRLLSTAANRFASMGLPSFPFAHLLVFWGGVQNNFNGFQHNPVEYARKVHSPVLLLHGDCDPRVTKEQAEAIADSFPGIKQCEVFHGVGHPPILACQPEGWKRCVEGFLQLHMRAGRKGLR